MSVYKRPGSDAYSYDFVHCGHRFSGSTGCTDKREAEVHEKLLKKQAKREAEAAKADAAKPMSFGQASSLFWEQVGQFYADNKETERILIWLQREIGKTTLLSSITEAVVAKLVAKKRAEKRTSIVNGQRVKVPISAATVNRSMTEPLRAILRRAEAKWGQTLPRIDWRSHKLKEPQERVREASVDEEAFLIASLPVDYQVPVRFAIMTGCRRAEIVGLQWSDVNLFAREFRVTGKGDKSRTIPMSKEVEKLLRSLLGQHDKAVFSFAAVRTRQGRVRGQRYPITVAGFETAWNRHARSKLTDFRFHDTRHTAATRLVRATGSIKMAQKLLGHTDISTTARYSHVTHEDLREGLEKASAAASPTKSPTQAKAKRGKVLTKQ